MRYSLHLLICGLIEIVGAICNIFFENYIATLLLLSIGVPTCLASFIVLQIENKENKKWFILLSF